MDTFRKFRIEQNALRIYIFATGFLLTAYCGLLCFGMRHYIAELTSVTFGYLLLCGGAWMYRICWLSWLFIIYTYLIRVCIIMHAEGFFDGTWHGCSIIDLAHYAAFTTGFILCCCFLYNIKRYLNLFDYGTKTPSADTTDPAQ